MDNQEDCTSISYYSYIISLLIKDNFGCQILEQTSPEELKEWPRFDSYDNFINNIVSTGSDSPIKSIRTIYTLATNFKNNKKLESIFKIENNKQKEFYELLIYYIFADSVLQLIHFADKSLFEDYIDLLNDLCQVCDEILKIKISESNKRIANEILSRLIKQCSFVLFYYNHKKESIIKDIENELVDDGYPSKVNIFILYRFVAPPEDYINLILSTKINGFDDNTKNECIMSSLLSHPEAKVDYNKILQLDRSSNKFEIEALRLSRDKSTTFKSIETFLGRRNDARDRNIYLRSILYLLRNSEFYPLNEFMDHNEASQYYFILQEKDHLSKYDNDNFIELFFNHIVSRIGNNDLSTKIIFNLICRNPIPNIKRFCKYFEKDYQNEVAAPFFRALTIVFDRKSGIIDGNVINSDELDDLKATIIKKYKEFEISITKDPSYCKTISAQECKSLYPDVNTTPKISEYAFNQRLSEAQNLTTGIITPENDEIEKFFTKRNRKIFIFRNIKKEAIEIQIIINLITILFHTMENMNIDADLFVPLIKMALHDQQGSDNRNVLQYFSLYAIQVFYIKKEKARFPILSAINQVMKEYTFGEKTAFTLLNLLNHLFSLPIFKVNMKDKKESEWFTKWSNEIQAILLVHLTSPFVHVRDMTLLVMGGLRKILHAPTIISLIDKYDKTMMSRISQRLQTTCNSSNTLMNLNFSSIMRSTNFLLSIYALIEYAQLLSRETMDGVLKAFYDIPLYKKINKKRITNDQLRYFVFAQRICPMFSTSKNSLNKKLSNFPDSISLKSYKIFDKSFSIDTDSYGMIDSLTKLLDRNTIHKYCDKLNEEEKETFNTFAALANSLSIELLPNFLEHFTSYLEDFIKKAKDTPSKIIQVIRLSIIIRCIVLSSDFDAFVYVYVVKIRNIYQQFINWFLQIYPFIPNTKQVKFEFLLCFFICVSSFSESLVQFRENVDLLWSIKPRQECFKFLLTLLDSEESKMATIAILKLIDSLPIFDSDYEINEDIYQSLIGIESKDPNARALKSILIQHPNLFNDFYTRSINFSINNGFYYFRAISEYFNFILNDFNRPDLYDKSLEIIPIAGKLILSSLVFIGTTHDECRKSAFSLLKCILPILCTFQNKNNIEKAGNINNYLNQHQKELSIYKIAPTNQQVFDLANCIAENLQYVVGSVFETFFSFFQPPVNWNDFILIRKNDDDKNNNNNDNPPNDSTGLTEMSPNYFSLLLNVVSPFARHLIFAQESPVYPSGFDCKTNKNGIEFINNLIDIHEHLSKIDIPFYVKILYEVCHNHDNIQTLAKILIMNASSQNIEENSRILNVTSILLLYLIQNVDSDAFLSLIVQRLSFGFWFTQKFGSSSLLTSKPYDLFDWIDLTLKIIHEVAISDFPRLLPYIHQIIHYCLIFNNYDEKTNFKLASLLQIIIKNIGVSDSAPKNDTVVKISESLVKLIPESISKWKNDALQWATDCGDLTIAGKSAIIYSLLKVDYKDNIQLEMDSKYKDTDRILKAFYLVFREFELNYSTDADHIDKIKNHLFHYLYGSLKMMLSNITFTHDVELNEDWSKLLRKIMKISIDVLSTGHISKHPPEAALKIIEYILKLNINALNKYYEPGDYFETIYIYDPQTYDDLISNFYDALHNYESKNYEETISKYYESQNNYYEYLAKLIVISFNEPRIVQIFVKLIVESKETKFKIISLGHLLIFFHATISAYYSINPFRTFIKDNFLWFLNDAAERIMNSDIGNNYKEIFATYFKKVDSSYVFVKEKNSIDLINDLIKEIWKSDYVANIVKFYNRIVYVSYIFNHVTEDEDDGQSLNLSSIIRDIVYVISKSFIENCPKDKIVRIPTIFKEIIPYAMIDNTKDSRNLISASSCAIYDEPEFDEHYHFLLPSNIIEDPKIPEPKEFIFDAYYFISQAKTNGRFYEPVRISSTIDFRNDVSEKIFMISTLFDNHIENQRADLFGLNYQPFEEQMTFWNKIKHEKFDFVSKKIPKDITTFEIFAHVHASIEKQKTTDELFADKEEFDPLSFILRNDEFESYEKRLKNESS